MVGLSDSQSAFSLSTDTILKIPIGWVSPVEGSLHKAHRNVQAVIWECILDRITEYFVIVEFPPFS